MSQDTDCEVVATEEVCDPLFLPPQLVISDVSSIATKQAYKFKRKLIFQVRKHRNLYDCKDKHFSNVESKEKAWLQISKTLKTDVDICRNTWADTRFEYQRYVRRLRKFFRTGSKNAKRRPNMALESEMLFLWRFVANKSCCAHPFVDNEENKKDVIEDSTTIIDTQTVVAIDDDDDDDIVLLEEAPVVIDLDDEDSYKKPTTKPERSAFFVTKDARKLAELIKVYPELYDSKHRYFTDYKRKGIIWNAIANEMCDKATKLMKFWIHMQTRYEWELNQPSYQKRNAEQQLENESELEKLLKFMQPHILANPNTVYKQSYFLQKHWQEPIEHFKNIYNLLAIMKKFPQALSFTRNLITADNKDRYQTIWNDISKARVCPAGQCETTWIILRTFYWELMNMRKQSYQLQDKWYFESIITELYTHADILGKPTIVTPPTTAVAAADTTVTPAPASTLAAQHETLPPTTVLVNLDEDMISSTTITTKRAHPAYSSAESINSSNNIKMPKITSAKSLAPSPAAVANISELVKASKNVPAIACPNTNGRNTIKMVQLPYHLPEHTKVIALPPQVNYNASVSTKLPTLSSLSLSSPSSSGPAIASSAKYNLNVSPAVTSTALTTASSSFVRPTTSVATTVMTVRPKTPQTTTSSAMPVDTMTMPKITGALSLLNPNEIMIELIGSANGNQLVVHGPPLSEKFSLSMTKTALFIREVMSIPLLHNKNHNLPDRVNYYWQYLSKKFKLPTHICKACWNFLSENFNHFPQIAPMQELMKPFKIDIQVWNEANDLFTNFDSNAVKMGWLNYQQQLPDLMEQIKMYPCLYKDITILSQKSALSDEKNVNLVWRNIRLRFPDIKKVVEIWTAFKNVFEAYMNELERGFDNKWPLNWWRVLAKLLFLTEHRYHSQEPFYYIVRNKVIEEIERCNLFEIKIGKQYKSTDFVAKTPETKRLETDPKPEPSTSLNALRLQTRTDIDAYALIMTIRRHPDIYQKCESQKKLNAWSEVAIEMNTSVSACRLTFQNALKTYRTHKACDPSECCELSQKYFKHFNAIYCAVKTKAKHNKLNIKTPFELNQSVGNRLQSNDINIPEKYIADIDMTNNKTSLVLKNWSYAIGTLRLDTQVEMEDKLRALFNKYKPLAEMPISQNV